MRLRIKCLGWGLARTRSSGSEIRRSVLLEGCQERYGREGAEPAGAVSGVQCVSYNWHALALPSLPAEGPWRMGLPLAVPQFPGPG